MGILFHVNGHRTGWFDASATSQWQYYNVLILLVNEWEIDAISADTMLHALPIAYCHSFEDHLL